MGQSIGSIRSDREIPALSQPAKNPRGLYNASNATRPSGEKIGLANGFRPQMAGISHGAK